MRAWVRNWEIVLGTWAGYLEFSEIPLSPLFLICFLLFRGILRGEPPPRTNKKGREKKIIYRSSNAVFYSTAQPTNQTKNKQHGREQGGSQFGTKRILKVEMEDGTLQNHFFDNGGKLGKKYLLCLFLPFIFHHLHHQMREWDWMDWYWKVHPIRFAGKREICIHISRLRCTCIALLGRVSGSNSGIHIMMTVNFLCVCVLLEWMNGWVVDGFCEVRGIMGCEVSK